MQMKIKNVQPCKFLYDFSESLYSTKGENLDNMQLKCNNINEVTYEELPVSE